MEGESCLHKAQEPIGIDEQIIRMLVITSSPLLDKEKPEIILDVEEERAQLRASLKTAQIPVEVTFLAEATIEQIAQALESYFDIIHFTGHGYKGDGRLVVEDGQGRGYPVEQFAFRNLFIGNKPKIVFLSACYSEGTAKEFIDMQIPSVICLSERISDIAATLFCQHFYHAVIRGKLVSDAFESAKRVVAAHKKVGDHYSPKDNPDLKYSQRFLHFTSPQYRSKPVFRLGKGDYKEIRSWAPTNVPKKVDSFIGREVDIIRIIEDLHSHRIINLVSEPGMGKSELAKAVAWWHLERHRFPGGVYWAGAGEEIEGRQLRDLDSFLNIILETGLDLPQGGAQRFQRHDKYSLAKSILANRCLLILENFENIKTDHELWDYIKNLPEQVSVLITNQEVLNPHEVFNKEVDCLSPDDSRLLFLSIIERSGRINKISEENVDLIELIVELLHGWPLAIEVTAGQIADCSLSDIFRELKENPSEILNSIDARTNKPFGIWTKLRSSYRRLNKTQKEIFRRMSIFLRPVEKDDIVAVLGTKSKQMLRGLIARRLIRHNGESYLMHPIIKQFAHNLMVESADNPIPFHLKAYEHFGNKGDVVTASDHLYVCGLQDDIAMSQFIDYTIKNLFPLRSRGLWTAAYLKAEQCLHGSKQILDRKSESIAISHIGTIDFCRGRINEALAHFQNALKIDRGIGNREGEAKNLGNIGNVYRAFGRSDEALVHYRDALKIDRDLDYREGEAYQLGNIGNSFIDLGQMDEALDHYQDALRIFKDITHKQGESLTLSNIGNIHCSLGEMNEALARYQDALSIDCELGHKQGEATQLGNIGHVYYLLGEMEKALDYFQNALKIDRELGYKKGEGQDLGNIGNCYYSLGRMKEALVHHQDALSIYQVIGHRQGVATQLSHIGNVYFSIDRMDEALAHYQDALIIDQEIDSKLGEGNGLGNIGNVFFSLGEMDNALARYQDAFRIFRDIGYRQGEAHQLVNIGNIHRALKDIDKAFSSYQDALNIFRELGHKRGEALTLGNMGGTYSDIDRMSEGLTYYQDALKINRMICSRRGEAEDLGNLGNIYYSLGQMDEALKHYQDARKIFLEIGADYYVPQVDKTIAEIREKTATC